MAIIKPFCALRPSVEAAAKVAALPYDVYNRKEAREAVAGKPFSFLNIDRPETAFDPDTDPYAPEVYRKADETLREWENAGVLQQDQKAGYYLYELTMNGRTQTGLVACSAVDDYQNGVILRHENTLAEKEQDRIRHIDAVSAQSGPIFLAYRGSREIEDLIRDVKETSQPVYDFISEDGIRHRVWAVQDPERIAGITGLFGKVGHTYIADGHHRAASAVKVSLKRRAEHPGYTGDEEFNYFLSVLFPDHELKILDYNRVLKDLAGLTPEALLDRLSHVFKIEPAPASPYHPEHKGEMGLLIGRDWYRASVLPELCRQDPVGCLDVAYLQREVLEPIWNITDPRTDKRIGFIGGIKGLEELERRCADDCAAAFAMYPTSMDELFSVADAGLLMPPKSTWFEPKLRSGLFIHKIER